MWIRALAGVLLLCLLWSLFRYAMGLRWEKKLREQALARQAGEGRKLIAEVPLKDGVLLVVDDGEALVWGEERQEFADVVGVRMLLNGGVLAGASRDGVVLPEPETAEEYEGRERWLVRVFRGGGKTRDIPCGAMREGVSREIAGRIFEVIRTRIGRGPAQSAQSSIGSPSRG
jgi:hypothetical protein